MESLLLWGLGLLAVALLLVVVEVFVPSGGVIAVTAAIVAIAGVVVLFRHDTTWGLIGLLTVLVMGPVSLGFAIKIWPNTPVGRKMIYGESSPERLAEKRRAEANAREQRQALVGAEGVAVTDLRPVGMIRLDGKRMEAHAEAGYVESGAAVRVTAVEDNHLKVRAVT